MKLYILKRKLSAFVKSPIVHVAVFHLPCFERWTSLSWSFKIYRNGLCWCICNYLCTSVIFYYLWKICRVAINGSTLIHFNLKFEISVSVFNFLNWALLWRNKWCKWQFYISNRNFLKFKVSRSDYQFILRWIAKYQFRYLALKLSIVCVAILLILSGYSPKLFRKCKVLQL